ncbi:MAG: GTPase HflX, partial [Trueperaceae bacterium]|nr:GTPase HflX [Trueperaceae bacterium]
MPPERAATAELARAMGELALEIARPVSVLIDRRGRVTTVAAGDAADTPLPPTAGEAEARLRGLRLVHVHLKPGGLSSADLTSLFLHRLDLIAAVDVALNERGDVVLGAAHLAMVAPPTADEEDWLIDAPGTVRDLERDDALQRIAALEEELARSWQARDVRRGSEERAVLVGIDTGEGEVAANDRLDELAELVRSAGGTVAARSLQRRGGVDTKTVVGRGKLDDLVSAAYHENADLLVFDRELTPAQTRELDKATNLKVLDRTQVILDIFAQNAKGREAQVQVELAQLQYQLPRLAGRGKAMSRLGGGIGTRGPGETKLEVDRRRIRARITQLEEAVDAIAKRRVETRKGRTAGPVPVIALVGYTNAGKSTLFNALAKSDALARNALFATLRPTTREGWLPGLGAWGGKVVYTDTVGFIRDLPDELVNAFRATLEELHDADLLLHVVDAAAPGAPDRVAAVDRILDDLKVERPRRVVLNKADAADPQALVELATRYDEAPAVSAATGAGLDDLKGELARWVGGAATPDD